MAIQSYLSKKEYLGDDDEFSNYETLREEYVEVYDRLSDTFDKTLTIASQAGECAEIVILKSSPIASVIIPMKNNLSAVSKLMSMCRAKNPDAAAITAEIASVRKMQEKDKVETPAIKTTLTKMDNEQNYFKRFYEYEAETLVASEKLVEFLNPEKEITDVDHIHSNKLKKRIQKTVLNPLFLFKM